MSDNDLPHGWRSVHFGDVVRDMADGGTPPRDVDGYFGGDISWAVVEDVRPRIHATVSTLSDAGLRASSAKLWPPGTIILTTGASIGNVGVAQVPLATKQGITGIVCDEEKAQPSFVVHWLQMEQAAIEQALTGQHVQRNSCSDPPEAAATAAATHRTAAYRRNP